MNKVSSSKPTPETREGRGTPEADAAIREARAGRRPVPEMLRAVLAAQLFVPLAAPPVVEGSSLKSWRPATITRQDTGGQFLVAFTDSILANTFSTANADYSYQLLVESKWLLSVLPADHGIVFNLGGGETNFEWTSEGISAYQEREPDGS